MDQAAKFSDMWRDRGLEITPKSIRNAEKGKLDRQETMARTGGITASALEEQVVDELFGGV